MAKAENVIDEYSDVETDYEANVDEGVIEGPVGPIKSEDLEQSTGTSAVRNGQPTRRSARNPIKQELEDTVDVDAFPTREEQLAQWRINVLAEFGLDHDPVVVAQDNLAPFSRLHISKVLGGQVQHAYANAHNKRIHLFPQRRQSPFLPAAPGEHGLFFTFGWRVEGENNGPVRLFIRDQRQAVWTYMGEYRPKAVRLLEAREWLLQSEQVKKDRVESLVKRKYKTALSVQKGAGKRKRLKLENSGRAIPVRGVPVTKQDVRAALDTGDEHMHLVALECVGYDVDVQHRLLRGPRNSTSDAVDVINRPSRRGQKRKRHTAETPSDNDSDVQSPPDVPSGRTKSLRQQPARSVRRRVAYGPGSASDNER
ncbi:hypothetical protein EXIGLDRAFT_747022 [Exidia glandulosa HHB12029]|uniref:DUF6697 domain-containing protein n=1 Tax=Exidia glandulosa HHB12029 TaxID=1314781 RepID=A0A165L8G6_EXIGL|nr:hypothetical protein EXIGLDRAFT_747022 [Exidia glandulosa HHB12029]